MWTFLSWKVEYHNRNKQQLRLTQNTQGSTQLISKTEQNKSYSLIGFPTDQEHLFLPELNINQSVSTYSVFYWLQKLVQNLQFTSPHHLQAPVQNVHPLDQMTVWELSVICILVTLQMIRSPDNCIQGFCVGVEQHENKKEFCRIPKPNNTYMVFHHINVLSFQKSFLIKCSFS